MMKGSLFFACLLLVPHVDASLPLVEWTWIHEPVLDDLYISTGKISVGTRQSLTHCFMACHLHEECISFFTWTVSGSLFCELNRKIFVQWEIDSFAVEATGYKYYKTPEGCPTGFGHRFSKPARMCIHLAAYNDRTFEEAVTNCGDLTPGAELIVLDDDVKRAEVAKTLVANSGFLGRYFWVNAARKDSNSPFMWSNGEEVDNAFFDPTSFLTENCVFTHINIAKTSMDGYTEGCEGKWPYICSLSI